MTQVAGVLLMTFGTANTLDEVPAYLSRVRGGREVPDELIAEMRRRFSLVGGSPLIRITSEQAVALETVLNEPGSQTDRDREFRVAIGMRHSRPTIDEGYSSLVDQGARAVIGVVMSPQFSPIIMGGYLRAFDAVSAAYPEIRSRTLGAWHEEPQFLDAIANRVRNALERIPSEERADVPVLFTAHSLPLSVATGEPDYIGQLQEPARLVAERAGLHEERWQFAYQSAGHTPEEWLTPDIKDLFTEIRAAGHRRVLIAPVQFLADHLEVLYDIDVAARDQAEAVGIELIRIESLNSAPDLIGALAHAVRHAVGEGIP